MTTANTNCINFKAAFEEARMTLLEYVSKVSAEFHAEYPHNDPSTVEAMIEDFVLGSGITFEQIQEVEL